VKEGTIKGNDGPPFAVVAVGASAGGLEAFSQLLRAIPNNTGDGFRFHSTSGPKYHSMLSELLAKNSDMPVLEAKNGASIKAKSCLCNSPNVNMGINGDSCNLPRTPRRWRWPSAEASVSGPCPTYTARNSSRRRV
jgi:two-component system CheB/CheR fusion protein